LSIATTDSHIYMLTFNLLQQLLFELRKENNNGLASNRTNRGLPS